LLRMSKETFDPRSFPGLTKAARRLSWEDSALYAPFSTAT
jgi:hypothetical protein